VQRIRTYRMEQTHPIDGFDGWRAPVRSVRARGLCCYCGCQIRFLIDPFDSSVCSLGCEPTIVGRQAPPTSPPSRPLAYSIFYGIL
jgi:hypothetical protein